MYNWNHSRVYAVDERERERERGLRSCVCAVELNAPSRDYDRA